MLRSTYLLQGLLQYSADNEIIILMIIQWYNLQFLLFLNSHRQVCVADSQVLSVCCYRVFPWKIQNTASVFILTPKQNWFVSPQEFAFQGGIVKQTSERELIRKALSALTFSYLGSQCHLADKYVRTGPQANSSRPFAVLPLPPSSVLAYRNSLLFRVGSYQQKLPLLVNFY